MFHCQTNYTREFVFPLSDLVRLVGASVLINDDHPIIAAGNGGTMVWCEFLTKKIRLLKDISHQKLSIY